MNEYHSDELWTERLDAREARVAPLSRLAEHEYDAARANLVDRLISTATARVPVSAFGSSI